MPEVAFPTLLIFVVDERRRESTLGKDKRARSELETENGKEFCFVLFVVNSGYEVLTKGALRRSRNRNQMSLVMSTGDE